MAFITFPKFEGDSEIAKAIYEECKGYFKNLSNSEADRLPKGKYKISLEIKLEH